MDARTAVRAHGLRVEGAGRAILRGLDFELPAHATTVLLGPGGSGKSTLLVALAGDEVLRRRELERSGELAVEAETTAYLPQSFRRDHRPLRDLLASPAAGDPGAADLLARVWGPRCDPAAALGAVLDRPLAELPLELVRLAAFTETVGRGSPLLLLDEPTADMEAQCESWIEARLRDLRGRRTIVAVTRSLRFARAVADVALLIIDGEIVEMDTAERFFTAPRHPRTAHFVRMGC